MTRTQSDCPVAPQSPHNIIVKLADDLTTGLGNVIRAGSYIEVDPAKEPAVGSTVLVDGALEPWAGQANILGTAVAVYSEQI